MLYINSKKYRKRTENHKKKNTQIGKKTTVLRALSFQLDGPIVPSLVSADAGPVGTWIQQAPRTLDVIVAENRKVLRSRGTTSQAGEKMKRLVSVYKVAI